MADFEITSPSGQVFVISAPEGATQEEVLAYAKSHMPATDTKAAPAKLSEADTPGIGMSALIGAGRTVDRLSKGVQQLYYGATGNKAAQADLKARAEEEDRLYKPLQEARPFATGLGEAVPSMVVPMGGSTTLLGNMVRLALAAGAPAALEYGTPKDRALRTLEAAGGAAAVPLGLAGIGAAGRTVKALAEPLYTGGREVIQGRLLNRLAGEDAPEVLAKLKAAQPLVPGSLPTAAEVAENGGIAAFQRMAHGANPSAYDMRFRQQASARLDALRDIAGDDAKILALKKMRADITEPSYAQSTNAVYTVDDALQNLLNRPHAKTALSRAETIAENDSRPFGFSTSSSAPFSGVGGAQPVDTARISGQGLQDLKMALDDMLKDPKLGIVGKEIGQVKNTRGQLIDWMEGANPEFKTARETYAKMSQPINQMQVGQELLKKLTPALSDYGALGKETGATFAKALRDSDAMVKTATGFKGAKGLEDVMGDKMGALTAIAQDLARKSNAQTLGGTIGSDTFQKMAMNNIASQSGASSLVGHLLETPGISRAMKWVYRDVDEKMQREIADALLDPAKAAKLIEGAPSFMQAHPDIAKALTQSAQRLGLAGALSLSQSSQ